VEFFAFHAFYIVFCLFPLVFWENFIFAFPGTPFTATLCASAQFALNELIAQLLFSDIRGFHTLMFCLFNNYCNPNSNYKDYGLKNKYAIIIR